MKINGWWSRSEEVLLACDVPAAQQLEVWVMEEVGHGRIVPPVARQLLDQLRIALRDVPPAER